MPDLYRGPEAASQPSEYVVRLAHDGRDALLGDASPGWHGAPTLVWGPGPYQTRFRALWTDEALVVRFDVDDRAPWFTRRRRDDCLWEEEVVEVFLDPTCSGCDYVELEISPANVICDLHIARLEPARDVRLEWDFATIETRVHADGRGGDGWIAIAWMPFTDFATVGPGVARCTPPAAGDVWHFNAFRIKRPHGPTAPEQDALYAAWSVPDATTFHTPAAFRPLRFAAG